MTISKARLKEVYESTMSVQDAMRELEIPSATTLYRLLKKAGIPLKTRSDRKPRIANVQLVD
jgi:hypothetical protein